MTQETDKLAERPSDPGNQLGRHFRTVSLATSVSRITGFVRDSINGALFGAGWVSDSYFMAIRIPSMLRDLFAEGALSSAFVPTFSTALKKGGSEEAWDLMTQVLNLLLLVVGILVGLGILFAPAVVSVIARGFLDQPDKFALTVHLTRILFPVLMFVSLAALWMGCLNAQNKFAVPAFAPVAMNLTLIAAGLYLRYFHAAVDVQGELRNMSLWAGATTLGMALQWAVQIPALRNLGWSFKWHWPPTHPGVFEMMSLMAPAILSQSAMQFNILINQFFASYLPNGDLSCLYYGNRLMQLPYGVFGVSIATVVFPLVSRHAAEGNRGAFQETLSRALEAAAFITLPCTLGLILTAAPITVLAFQHGRFDPSSTARVTEATMLYVAGLFFFSSNKIMIPPFYALRKSRWPLISASASVAADFILNFSTFRYVDDMHLRFLALPAATSLAAVVNFAMLQTGLHRYGIRLEYRAIGLEVLRILSATVVMGLAVWGTLTLMDPWSLPWMKVWRVFLPITLGAGVYFIAAKSFKCRSLAWVRSRGKTA